MIIGRVQVVAGHRTRLILLTLAHWSGVAKLILFPCAARVYAILRTVAGSHMGTAMPERSGPCSRCSTGPQLRPEEVEPARD